MKIKHEVEWIDGNRLAEFPADPDCPNGIHVDLSGRAHKSCKVNLPYPARRCGYYSVRCPMCHMSVLVTTAGRADDPRSVRIACKPRPGDERARVPASKTRRAVSLVRMPWDK